MATGFTDWSEYDVNDALLDEDWSLFVGGTQWAPTVISTDGPAGRAVRATTPSGLAGATNHSARWDALSADEDWETLVLIRRQNAGEHNWGTILRAQSTSAYCGALRNNSTDHRIYRFSTAGGFDGIEEAAHNLDTTDWLWQRVRVEGTALKLKSWQADPLADDWGVGDEPGSWSIEETDSTITGSGLAGLLLRPSAVPGGWVEWGWFGWATSGDTAPGPTTATPGEGEAHVTAVASVSITGQSDQDPPEPFSVVLWETWVETELADADGEGDAHVAAVGSVSVTGTKNAQGESGVSAVASVTTTGTAAEVHAGQAHIVATGSVAITGTKTTHGGATVSATGSVSATGVQEGVVQGEAHVSATASVSVTGTKNAHGEAHVAAVTSVSATGSQVAETDLPAPVVIGTTSIEGATATITVTDVVPAGVVVFVDLVHRNPNDIPAISDSAGNTYAIDLNETRGAGQRAIRFRASDAQRLVPGNTITLDGFAAEPDGLGAVVAYYVSAILGEVEDTARHEFSSAPTANSGPATVTVAPSLLLGLLETNGGPSLSDTGNLEEIERHVPGGGGSRSVVSAYRAVGVPDDYDWDVEFNSNRTGSINLQVYPILGLLSGTITIRSLSGPAVPIRLSGPRVAIRINGPNAR